MFQKKFHQSGLHNKGLKRFMGQSEIKCLFQDAIFNVTNKVRKEGKKLDRHTSVDNFKGFKSHQGKLDVAVRNS